MRRLFALVCALVPIALGAQDFTTYKGHGGPVMGLAMSSSGQLASASFDNSVGLWSNGRPTWLEGHDAAVTALRFSGETLYSGSDDFRVLRWTDAASPELIAQHQGKVSAISVSPINGHVATASWDGSIQLHRAGSDDSDTLLGHQSNVTDVAFLPSGVLLSASSDGTLRVWEGEAEAKTPRTIVRHGFGINRLVVGDAWVAYGAVDGGTRIVNPETGEQIADFTLDRRPILSMAYHVETGQLAVGDGHGYIMMIDTNRWRITRDFRAMRQGPVWALAFSPDGTVIHAGGLDDVIYVWPVALLNEFEPADGEGRTFLRAAETMPNGERQFMRKCSICHALEPGPSRKAGPTLYGVFGRKAGAIPEYRYSDILTDSTIVWDETTIDALFDEGPDHYIPGSKMPMQVIAQPQDRADLIAFLQSATRQED